MNAPARSRSPAVPVVLDELLARLGVLDSTQACWRGAGLPLNSTCPVGLLPAGATPSGIYDLAGNVEEWNADWLVTYRDSPPGCWANTPVTDPICLDRAMAPAPGNRVVRGGAWIDASAVRLHSASRFEGNAISRKYYVGFRCARDTH